MAKLCTIQKYMCVDPIGLDDPLVEIDPPRLNKKRHFYAPPVRDLTLDRYDRHSIHITRSGRGCK